MPALTRAQRIQAQTHSTAARDALPDLEAGRFIWNGTDDEIQIYDGVNWQTLLLGDGEINGGTF